jgi:amino-acid N-acetyltransferase
MKGLQIRQATAADQAAIVALVRRERLNPNGLHWFHFVVATLDDEVIGAVQMRAHADGSRELGSLVVSTLHRGQGVAASLVTRLLEAHHTPVHLITARARASYFARWGFDGVRPKHAPRAVRRNHCMGQVLGACIALLRGRRPRRLVVLERG